MSVVMMEALKVHVASLTRQVESLAPENERVRKLLTEFDRRHDADQQEIARCRYSCGVKCLAVGSFLTEATTRLLGMATPHMRR